MSTYDVIVIGAGHNGLTTAATLARAGRAVLVVEAREQIGGLAAAHEFHAGHRVRLLQDTTHVRASIVRDLELEAHGLRWRSTAPDVLALGKPGDGLWIRGDRSTAAREIAARSQRDGQRYDEMHDLVARMRDALGTFLDESPIDVLDVESASAWDLINRALRVRKIGRRDLMELLRLPPMCVADWLNEWFEQEVLKAALALPAVGFDFTGPWSPGTNANFLFDLCSAGPGIEGDGPALVAALEKSARAAGAEVRTSARVEQLRVDGHVCGVVLADGEVIEAPVVAASCHPVITFLRLMPRRTIPGRLLHRVQRFRTRGTTAVVAFALRDRLRFVAHDNEAPEFVRIASSLDGVERAFDAVKYARMSERPALQLHVDATEPGHDVVSALVHYAPYGLEGGWDDAARARLVDRVRETIEAHTGSLDVVASHAWAPPDLESEFGLPGGNLHHGEHALDQILVRPVPECCRYATPVPGLFLCGSGSHPGGGITCAPGALAARTIRSAT